MISKLLNHVCITFAGYKFFVKNMELSKNYIPGQLKKNGTNTGNQKIILKAKPDEQARFYCSDTAAKCYRCAAHGPYSK